MKRFFFLIFFLLLTTILILVFLTEVVQGQRYISVPLKVEIQRPSISVLASLANFLKLNRSHLLQITVGLLLVINLFLAKRRENETS